MKTSQDKPNIVILITDQQRALQHWPASWEEENLPSLMRLKRNGLSFNRAFTSASACSSSRATLLTGTFPETNGVKNTLQMPGDILNTTQTDLDQLDPSAPNLARMLTAAGYSVTWKGKWHLSLPRNGGSTWTEEDIRYMEEAYGFAGWNPNDAGNSEADPTSLGAGTVAENDQRYISGPNTEDGSPKAESALDFIRDVDPSDGPFCLFVSLVNPHDIWVAPNFNDEDGYTSDLGSEFGLPAPSNANNSLAGKPEVQAVFKATMALGDNPDVDLTDVATQQTYVNFYAYLQTLADQQLGLVLDALQERDLIDDTLIIRIADHGEMGLSHGLREKDFVAYDEAIRIPMIFSNPKRFPEPVETDSLAALVDLAPTLTSLTGVLDAFSYVFKGKDLSPILQDPSAEVQEYIHFTTDDQALALPSGVPAFIRAIRSKDWMYAVYFTADGTYDYELYDMTADPDQNRNLAGLDEFAEQQIALHGTLQEAMTDAATLPPSFFFMTPALAADYPSIDDCPNPIWPTPEGSVTDAQRRSSDAAKRANSES